MENGDTLIYFKTARMNFTAAQETCRTLNMSLIVPKDEEENVFIARLGGSFLGLEMNFNCKNKPYNDMNTRE